MSGRILRALPVVSLLIATLPAAALADQPAASPSVTISDSGMSPRGITVGAGDSVMWTNAGNNVHTATSVRGTVLTFDTGGLSHGQAASSTFGVPGTYSYASATDCGGNSTPGFDCGPYTVVVVATGPASAGVAPSASPTVAVSVDDTNGFQPASLTIQAGQAVIWNNAGSKVHTVSSDGGYVPGYDSGGLNPGQTFSYTFAGPGIYTYHSTTEPIYFQDPNAGATARGFAFKGTITVVTPGGLQPTPTAVPAPERAAPAGLAFVSKDVATSPIDCGGGNRVPCVSSAPNNGTFYVQGHAMDKNGQGIAGLMVQTSNTGGGGISSATTEADGLFTIVLFQSGNIANSYCPAFPFARIYSVWLADSAGRVLSDTRTFPYTNCATAGEFHFDFVKQG